MNQTNNFQLIECGYGCGCEYTALEMAAHYKECDRRKRFDLDGTNDPDAGKNFLRDLW